MRCKRCDDTGAVGKRYCDCLSAEALRARIDADPRIQELRARIDRILGHQSPCILVDVQPGVSVIHDLDPGQLRAIPVPSNAPEDVKERIRAWNEATDPKVN